MSPEGRSRSGEGDKRSGRRVLRRPQRDFPVPVVTRVRARNYKSIGACDVGLNALTLLVGQNGAGKSNFLDILRFTSDALRNSVEYAIRERGGVGEVRRRSRGHPTHFGIRLDLDLGNGVTSAYAFRIAARKGQTFEVQREECRVMLQGNETAGFNVASGTVTDTSLEVAPPEIEPDRLFLPLASGYAEFRRVYQALSTFGFYNLNLSVIREPQDPDPGELLHRDGGNLAAVVRRMNERDPRLATRVVNYLRAVVPGVHSVGPRSFLGKETLEFRQEVAGDPNPWRYLAASVSDGTLRALGVLVAVFQPPVERVGIPLVGIEEPEVAIHPGAAIRLMDALLEASKTRQVLITTHSPDLLDHPDVELESVLVVEAQGGNTMIAPVPEHTVNVVREHLYTVGELLRMEQISPDLFLSRQRSKQLRLFG